MPKFKKLNLFLTLFDVFTFIIWGWLLMEFLTKGEINLPTWISTFYLLILVYYVSDKEIRRWRKKYFSKYRRGEYFVYLWGLTLVIIVGYCVWGGNRLDYSVPHELPTIAGSVLILYIITEYLKEEFRKKKK